MNKNEILIKSDVWPTREGTFTWQVYDMNDQEWVQRGASETVEGCYEQIMAAVKERWPDVNIESEKRITRLVP